MKKFNNVFEFQEAYKTRKEKEEALKHMSDEEIDVLISTCPNIQGKMYYASFKKNKKTNNEKKE